MVECSRRDYRATIATELRSQSNTDFLADEALGQSVDTIIFVMYEDRCSCFDAELGSLCLTPDPIPLIRPAMHLAAAVHLVKLPIESAGSRLQVNGRA